MRRRSKILLLGACGLMAVVAVCFFSFRDNGPGTSYNGRTLSQWIALYGDARNSPDQRESGRAAIAAIGTNAIPYLLRWMQYYPSSFGLWVWHRLPRSVARTPFVANRLSNQGPIAERADNAYRAFAALGPIAAPAVDELARRAAHSNDDIPSLRALLALGTIGPPAYGEFIECVSKVDTNIYQPEFIATFAKDLRPALPLVINQLHASDPKVRATATNVLQIFAPEILTDSGRSNN